MGPLVLNLVQKVLASIQLCKIGELHTVTFISFIRVMNIYGVIRQMKVANEAHVCVIFAHFTNRVHMNVTHLSKMGPLCRLSM